MNIVKKTITEIIDTEYKAFALYTLEHRAIPSYIDGQKSVGRKLIYSMINNYKGKKIKVNELGSSIASVANYHHGETSAQKAVVTMTATWNNNVPLFNGYGNFGSRLIQESSAPRYIYAEMNPDFYKYFTDFAVCNENSDKDNPEPQQYLPLIPWVLVNGIEGIAVGFACKFLSHDAKDIASLCIKALNGKLKDTHVLEVKLPFFKGEIIQVASNIIATRGLVERSKKNTWTISELPWGYDREKYFNVLEKLVVDKKIIDFDDLCDESGFRFVVKMDSDCDIKCENNPIDYFKLEKTITENYTALDENGNLIIFENKIDIINTFVKFRIGKIKERIDYDIAKIAKDIHWNSTKLLFTNDVVNKKLALLNVTRSELTNKCIEKYKIEKDMATRLLSIPIYDMTADMIHELENKIDKLNESKDTLTETDPIVEYIRLLKAI